MSDRLSAAALATGAPVHWLLDLTWAGRVWRLSDEDLEVETQSGDTYVYRSGLTEVAITETFDLLADASASPAQATVEFFLGDCNVAELVARGHALGSGRGTLRRWVEGTEWDQALVMLVGFLSNPEYGSFEEPVRATLQASVWIDQTTIPSSAAAVKPGNWSVDYLASLAEGEWFLPYPLVYGRPGVVDEDVRAGGWMAATEAVWVQHDPVTVAGSNIHGLILVAAGHHVTAQTAYISTITYGVGMPVFVYNGYDLAGHPIAFVPWYAIRLVDEPFEYSGSALDYTWTDGSLGVDVFGLGDASVDISFQPEAAGGDAAKASRVYVGWKDLGSPAGGGKAGDDGELLLGAGDILADLMKLTHKRVDRGRMSAAQAELNRFELSFQINAYVKVWDYVQAHVLPVLPVSVETGPEGAYVTVWRHDARASDAIAHIVVDEARGVVRSSPVTCDRDDLGNKIRVRYAWSPRIGGYLGEVILDATDADGARPDLYCIVSQSRYRTDEGDPLVVELVFECPTVYSTATAWQVAQWRAAAHALERRRVSVVLPEARWGWLAKRKGAVLLLTDEEVFLDEAVVLLEELRIMEGGLLEAGFLLIEDPARDLRT